MVTEVSEQKEALASRNLLLNVGPSHPAMHGVIRILAELEGETVVKASIEIGYLHRGFEKSCENGSYTQAIPYRRIGGVSGDLPEGFEVKARETFRRVREVLAEVDKLLTRNRIFVDRLKEVGVISKEDAVAYGFTGPVLRSTGVNYDVRKHE